MSDSKKSTQQAHEEKAEENQNHEQITIDFLKANPDFFLRHDKLLASLRLKHESGSAVSLIERQVEKLRKENHQLKGQLNGLVGIAQENESYTKKMHHLTLDLLACKNPEGINNALGHRLTSEFSADVVALRLFRPEGENWEIKSDIVLDEQSDDAQNMLKIVNKRLPECGFFKKLNLEQLFGDKAEQVASMAVLPLFIDKNRCFGSLILASHNLQHFNPNMGTLFLESLAEVVSHALYKYIHHTKQ